MVHPFWRRTSVKGFANVFGFVHPASPWKKQIFPNLENIKRLFYQGFSIVKNKPAKSSVQGPEEKKTSWMIYTNLKCKLAYSSKLWSEYILLYDFHIYSPKMTTFWRGTGVYKVLEIWQICLGKLWPLSIHYPERGWEKQIRPNLENIKRLSFLLINCLQKKEPILWNIFFSLDHNINFASSLIPFSCVWLKCRRQFSEVTLVCWSSTKATKSDSQTKRHIATQSQFHL